MTKTTVAFLVLCSAMCATSASAGTIYDGTVTNNVIFGSGNLNGSWTIDQNNGVELGLRAKVRFDDNNQPQNIFNSNGAGVYTFDPGQPSPGFGFAPNSSSSAKWNFEWSINSDYLASSGSNLSDLNYLLEIDFDPSIGTNFQAFDPINVPDPDYADHAIGDNSTVNGGGTSAGNRADYLTLIGANNLAQNSWNMEFFDSASFPFNSNQSGIYEIRLSAFDAGGSQLAQTSITVSTVPEPSTMLSFACVGLFSMGMRRRRR
ncbi:PEP-CTERM sorting domain-containing protein [Stieleria mannarensis]|uniref:PEP-CTERM sorting domain-containing protein n=1 Tax=Stieleria mannarensis TaxID=2755585 RepID=UPI0016034BDE|nr:PEP-CTERM sorting domain-containing protein [Rhodopirellula sp. JC639]